MPARTRLPKPPTPQPRANSDLLSAGHRDGARPIVICAWLRGSEGATEAVRHKCRNRIGARRALEAARLMQDGVPRQRWKSSGSRRAGAVRCALFMLAASYLELGKNDKALHYASAAVEREPSSAPARDVLAKVQCGFGGLHLGVCRTRRSCRPSVANSVRHRPTSIRSQRILPCIILNSSTTFSPAIEMGRRRPASSLNNLTACGATSRTSSTGQTAKRRGCPLMEAQPDVRRPAVLKVSEEKLPRYLNPDVDYRPVQQAIVAGS